MPQHHQWVVVADAGRARFLTRDHAGQDLEELETLTDAAARADNADLRRDAFGSRNGGTMASAGEDKLDHEEELFARRVAQRLLEAHQARRYDQLRICAAPHFLGRLRKVLAPEVTAAVVDELDKDLLQLDARALTRQLYGNGAGPAH